MNRSAVDPVVCSIGCTDPTSAAGLFLDAAVYARLGVPATYVVAGVTELKQHDGGPFLVAGSQTLVHTLLDNGLVDELRLMVFPVTIGAGLRVFPDTIKKTPWELTDTVTFPSKVRVDTYLPA